MIKSKDKQIRELREDKDNWFYVGVIFIVFSLFLGGWIGYLKDTTVHDLESQLQSCQEKISIWTLKVECIDSENANYIYFENNYTDYELYLEVIERFDEFKAFENCEVLE